MQNDQLAHFEKLAKAELLALQALQPKLTMTAVPALPRSTGTFKLGIDPCDRQVGLIALQKQPKDHTKRLVIGEDPSTTQDATTAPRTGMSCSCLGHTTTEAIS